MKSFAVALILLLSALCGIVLNCIYINNVANKIENDLETLANNPIDENCIRQAKSILEYWKKNVEFVEVSVAYSIADRVSEQAVTLVACAEAGDLYGFRTAYVLLRDAIEDMRRLEKLRWKTFL